MGEEDMNEHRESTPVQDIFDYTLLEEKSRMLVQIKAEAIKMRMKRTAEDIIAIGQDLLEVKQALRHGQFKGWVKAEFDMSYDTAINFMQVAKKFGELDEFKSGNFPFLSASVLYELAGPKMPDHIVENVLSGRIDPTIEAMNQAKEAQQKTEDELSQVRKERTTIGNTVLHMHYEQEVLQQELKKIKEERDHLKRELQGGLQAYYDQNLEMKTENTFLGLLTHGMQKLAEVQQFIDHTVSSGMLQEVRRLGEGHQDRFLLFLAQIRSTYTTLYEAEIKLTHGKDEIVESEP